MVDSHQSFSCLPDPYQDRACNQVPCPPNKSLESKVLFPYSGNYYKNNSQNIIILGADVTKPNWETMRDYLLKEGIISK